ncbi:MAG: preprotein translocase subunit SecE [Candidatus Kuenenbacteria bacterium]
MNKLVQYIKDSKSELKKVIWPTKKQAINHTALVIGFSLAVAAFLGIIDFALNKLLETVL